MRDIRKGSVICKASFLSEVVVTELGQKTPIRVPLAREGCVVRSNVACVLGKVYVGRGRSSTPQTKGGVLFFPGQRPYDTTVSDIEPCTPEASRHVGFSLSLRGVAPVCVMCRTISLAW